ncbi:MAG: hypothetical protein AAB355_00300 [Patescibacteria group bacterium]
MIEDALLQYGMAGIFISYLIFDRQILLKKLGNSIDALTDAIKNKNI